MITSNILRIQSCASIFMIINNHHHLMFTANIPHDHNHLMIASNIKVNTPLIHMIQHAHNQTEHSKDLNT